MSRPYHVFDYEGEYLGSFASWETAHEWAHIQALLGGVPAPLTVEYRRTTESLYVWADRCEPATGPTGGTGPAGELDGSGLFQDVHRCATAIAVDVVYTPPRPRQPS